MRETELERKAVEEIARRASESGIPDPRVIHADSEVAWDPTILRRAHRHSIHVLQRGPDLVVFFGADGSLLGWRDDGRTGSPMPGWVDREAFLRAVAGELGLPACTRLGRLEPVELPPLGWTHEAVLFLAPVPRPEEVLRVWASPETLRVIQCLIGAPRPEGGSM